MADPLDDLLILYLNRAEGTALAPLMVRNERECAVLLFRDEALAVRHRETLGDARVERIEADDMRAKEEVLRAALSGGAAEIWWDASPETLLPASREPTLVALHYVLSFKRAAACL